MRKLLFIPFIALTVTFFLPGCKKDNAAEEEVHFGKMTQKNLPLEKVDLGLPSGNLWASYNLGATAPDETGNYYAWGETSPKSIYQWSNYKFGEETSLTKYVFDDPKMPDLHYGKDGFTDNILSLLPEDDAAVQILKEHWCTPSTADVIELFVNCEVSWEQYEEGSLVWGVRFRSKKNQENVIFVPAAGIYYAELDYLNETAAFWTSTLTEDNGSGPGGLACSACSFGTTSFRLSQYLKEPSQISSPYHYPSRFVGMPIRPVYKQ